MRRPYVRPISNTWWLQRWPYTKFMLREISSVFIAIYLVLLLVLVGKIEQGQAAYDAYLAWFRSPLLMMLHVVSLAFALMHTVTWFNLTPKAMPIRIGEEPVPPVLIAGSNYVAWIVVSAVVAMILLG